MVDKILECTFTEHELVVPSKYTADDKRYFYRFMMQSIYDAHLPVTKAIGFCLNTPKKSQRQSATRRCSHCLENMVEISTNLDDKVFLNVANNIVVSNQMTGKILATKDMFTSNTHPVDILSTSEYVMTSIQPLSLEIYVETAAGYRTMEDNSKYIGKNKYFPMNSYHSLLDYVRVLPYDGSIRYKLYRGMTPDMLRQLYVNYYAQQLSGNVTGGEAKWLSSFPL